MLAVAVIVTMPVRFAMAQETDMSAMIGNAKTPADHEALAKMYQDEADKAKAQAAAHNKMAEAYAQYPRMNELTGHCKRLANYYKEAAKEYSLMATLETDKSKQSAAP
jgi:hypothetical protein